jgi:heme o synthase
LHQYRHHSRRRGPPITAAVLKTYYRLTKPGIIYGNAIPAIAAFLLASRRHINIELLLATLVGLSLIIASACVFNNYTDRGIDRLMARTKRRALVQGLVSGRNALIYATVLGLVGTTTLLLFTNRLTTAVALFGLFAYVVLYGIGKRRTVYGTIIGSLSGAIPPVVGYTAVAGRLDATALALFLILVFWQMPHFYAIAMYRLADYKAAHIPVLPAKKGFFITKINILGFIVGFILAASLLTVFGAASYIYLTVALILGLTWFGVGLAGFRATDDAHWARRMFLISLLVLTILCATIALDATLR